MSKTILTLIVYSYISFFEEWNVYLITLIGG